MEQIKPEAFIAGVIGGAGLLIVLIPLSVKLYLSTVRHVKDAVESIRKEIVPEKGDSGVTSNARLWQTIATINETTGRLAASDGQLTEKVAVHDTHIQELRTNLGVLTGTVNKLKTRVTNVEDRCNMQHRKADDSDSAQVPVVGDSK